MVLGIACDHAGVDLKNILIEYLEEKGHEVKNYGTDSYETVDYPHYSKAVTDAIQSGEIEQGILICGSGVGISLAANKAKGIRAVVCSEPYSSKLSKEHNDTNVLALGARVVGPELAKMIVDAWLEAEFMGGIHTKRVELIEAIHEED